MTFQLVYYSQQDPKWKQDVLGFGSPQDTIGYVGCALTSAAMLLSGHGFAETPKTLNKKLQSIKGFYSAGIVWGAVSQLYPQITVKSNISCQKADAPLGLIDASIKAGQPVIVMVDSTPADGLLTHWVVLYAKEGSDYLMLDPWPYQTDVAKKTYLMPRYSQGNTLKRSIMHIIIYENFSADGRIAQPGISSTTGTDQTPPLAGPVITSSASARVKADVTWGLNIRSSIDTSSKNNIVAVAPAGSALSIIESDGASKIGAINQWVRVRSEKGQEGFAAAWYLEKIQTAAPVKETAPVSPPTNEADTLSNPTLVMVKGTVGKFGAKIYQTASKKSSVLSTEKARAKLVLLEDMKSAKLKIGKAGKWLNVQTADGAQGFVDAEIMKMV
jgi:hypothetical protein